MQVASRQGRLDNTYRELIALSAASLACVVVLTVALADSRHVTAAGLDVRHLLLLALVAGGAAFAVALIWGAMRKARRAIREAQEETAGLRRSLIATEAIIKAEPQVLVFWEQAKGLRVVTHSLGSVQGIPEGQRELLRFGGWLDARSAEELRQGLDRLFADGRPFNLLLKTNVGGHLEADGRAAGSRAVLRFRDVAGYKRDLVRIIDQHRTLARDIRASRALLNVLPMPIWLKSDDGRIDWVNDAYVKAVEAASDDEVRERQIELLESRHRATVDRSLAHQDIYRKRLEIVSQGQRRAHDIVVLPLGDATVAAAIDVDELEAAKAELNRRKMAYDRTLDRVSSAVATFGADRRLSFFNPAYQTLWQLDAEWLRSRPTHGEILDRLRELARLPAVRDYREWKDKLVEGERAGVVFEDLWHLPDGRMINVVGDQRPDGGVTYLFENVTERLALESRYNALIDVQTETLDSLKEGVAVFATDGRLKLYNSSFTGIWKLSPDALRGEPHIDSIIAQAKILTDDPRIWTRISAAVTSISDQRDPIEGQMVRPDSSIIDYAAIPLPDGATLVTFVDVTATRHYERALIERNEALVAGDRLKSQFISHVSYELRTPLTNIIGFSELLATPRTGPLNEKQREYLGDITASSKTLLSIIDDILDLATIDAGALDLKLSPVKVRPIIDAAILGVRERAGRARLTIDIALADDAIEFIADEARIRQILYNLLSNAIGFSKPNDTIRVSAWCEDGMMAFAVEDQGVGIPKDQQDRVFERFETHSQGSRHRGAGLGLSIVKSLVALHGGDMRLESEPGRGTRVTVRFPESPAIHHEADVRSARA
jgi:signal transduction histidine kinase